ncbi:MAG: hypoxanthine phosphoribosyltransferase [Calditrichaeota bacterium]|nr:MAG: hypoxanthine phosphoribosyltransferase [Calditrichota bacterium]
MNTIKIDKYTFAEFISADKIAQRISELGEQITTDYKDKTPIVIGVLNGSVIFFSDLIREIKCDVEIDFLRISSYEKAMESSGVIKVHKDLNSEIEGRHIIIVEDIVDSGLSVRFLKAKLEKSNPASLKVASLLLKPTEAQIDFPIDYTGFEIPPAFVIGYGLDYNQKFRNLKSIYSLVLDENGKEES